MKRESQIVWHEIVCVVCGVTVKLTGAEYNWRNAPTTCSGQCSRRLRSRVGRAFHYTKHEETRLAAMAASPLSGRFESNKSAKEWSLRAPKGQVFRFRNLSLFIRSNADLFEPADIEPWAAGKAAGSACNANVYLGLLRPGVRRQRAEWKGWTWAAASEE